MTLEQRREALSARWPRWEKRTLDRMFRETAVEYGSREFILDGERCFTYRQALTWVREMAAGLLECGLRPGDHVAVSLDDCAEALLLTFAISRIGCVKISVNTRLCNDELVRVLLHSRSAAYIGVEQYRFRNLDELLAAYPFADGPLVRVLLLDGPRREDPRVTGLDRLLALGRERLARGGADCAPAEDPDAASDIFYTSGSSGRSKGVMLSHDMLLRSAYANCLNRGFEDGRRILTPLPMFHIYGYVEGLLASLFVGGTLILTQGSREEHLLDLIQRHRAGDILSVPIIMNHILQCPRLGEYDLSSLQAVYCSASACPAWLWAGIRDKLGVHEITTGYGMTEVCAASMQTPPTDDVELLCTRVGRVLPGGCAAGDDPQGHVITYRVMDPDTGAPLAAGEAGELWCKGPTVMHGYYDDPETTRQRLTPDGWLKTGDIGRFDENGYLEFCGRCSDMYKINGENVLPNQAIEAIESCPKVRMACVIGVPDERTGEAGAAFIELREGESCTWEEILPYCRDRLADFQFPKYHFFLTRDQWPLNATGKLIRYQLRRMAQERIAALAPETSSHR